MEKFIEIMEYFTPAKIIGAVFALGTLGYLFYLTIKHKDEFWEAFKGENKKLDIIEAVVIVWLVLFVAMTVGDFTLGLIASEEAWYSMDAVFLFAVAGKSFDLRQRGVNPPK
jgi:hypothetical protein